MVSILPTFQSIQNQLMLHDHLQLVTKQHRQTEDVQGFVKEPSLGRRKSAALPLPSQNETVV